MKHFLYHIFLIIVSMLFLLVMYSFYLLFYPVKTIEIKQEEITVINKEIHQEEELQYVFEYCNYTDKPFWESRFFLDGLVFSLDPIVDEIPVGCAKKIVSIPIPETLPSGEYSFKIVSNYQINPLRNITKTFQTEKFKVIKEQEGQ